MTETDFCATVTHALQLYRKGRILELGASPLGTSALVAAEFLVGDTITDAARGYALAVVLAWGIEELCPQEVKPDSTTSVSGRVNAPAWHLYKILHDFYLEHWTIEQIAEALGFAPTSIANLRKKALNALADLLQSALSNPDLLAARQQATIARRYQQLPSVAQAMLRFAALFFGPAPVNLLIEVGAEQAEAAHTYRTADALQQHIVRLEQQHLLLYASRTHCVTLPPSVRAYGMSQLGIEERPRWHQRVAQYYETQFEYIEAAHHWYWAQAGETAAMLLLTHQQTLINRMEWQKLEECLALFRPVDITAATRAHLKLLAGQVAELRANFADASAAYAEALQVADAVIQAEAHYRLAKILEYRNVDEALVHYGRGIDLLERTGADNPLLVKMYIHRSWIFIQDRQDFLRAEASLTRAKALIHPQNRQDYADLYNAAGELSHREEKWSRAVEERLQAWLAAKESNDLARMIKISYNLGRDYTELRRFDQAAHYLDQSHILAQQSGMLDMAANCQEVIGIGYFYQERYGEAIQAYRAAYDLFTEVKNQTALVNTCFNLAEAYAINGDGAQARQYYTEGLTLATTLTQDAATVASLLIVQRFAELKQQYPLLFAPDTLNPRQQQALDYIQQHGQIANRTYRRLNRVENKTAAEDLKQLVNLGLLQKVGEGAATFYRFSGTITAPVAITATQSVSTTSTTLLNQRQQQALTYVEQHGEISNRLYRVLTGVGNKAAAADLRDLVKKGIFHQNGKGPATVYQLVVA